VRARVGRHHIVVLAVLAAVASTVFTAAPAGAVGDACEEHQAPFAAGQSSGLKVACTFTTAGLNGLTSLTITDYADAEWHAGAARRVSVTVQVTSGSTAGKLTIRTCPTNNTNANVIFAACPSPGSPSGNLAISSTDVDHSIESTTAGFLAPGTFIKSIASTVVTLSKPTIAGGPGCPGGALNCAVSVPFAVLVANSRNRAVTDGTTTNSSNTISSATANFGPLDVGMRVRGGSLPKGTTIQTYINRHSVSLACTGCSPSFSPGLPGTASNVTFSITRAKAPTSTRYVPDGSSGANMILTSATAMFANSDIGLPVFFNPGIAGFSRIAAVAANGSSATLTRVANLPSGAKKFTIGYPTKNAPTANAAVGRVTFTIHANPAFDPSAPPCAANQQTVENANLIWKNPGAYDLAGLSGSGVPTSTGQFDITMGSTTFAGFLLQNVTVAGGVPTTSRWAFKHTFIPLGAAVCPGTPFDGMWRFDPISFGAPFAGPEGERRIRGLRPEPQGVNTLYVGATGATVLHNGGVAPTNTNACVVSSGPC
jgi:hypothetical protein